MKKNCLPLLFLTILIVNSPARAQQTTKASLLSERVGKKDRSLRFKPVYSKPNHKSIHYDSVKSLSFSDYLIKVREVVQSGRITPNRWINSKKSLSEVDINTPFEWKHSKFDQCQPDEKIGILMIHGLTDSPFSMWDIGRSLEENKCLLIRSILLPGHGTVPGDLINVKVDEWIAATTWAIKSFKNIVSGVYIAGYSTGGALAVHHTLTKISEIDPPVQKRSPHIIGILLFSPGIATSLAAAITPTLADLGDEWIGKKERDLDYSKYESFPTNAAAQFYLLTKKIRRKFAKNEKVNIPVFVAVSMDDTTVKSNATFSFFKEHVTERVENKSKMLVFTRSKDQKKCENLSYNAFVSWTNIVCLQSDGEDYPNVISSSHLAVPIAPLNFHYGLNGDYPACTHYAADSYNFEKCLTNPKKDVVWAEKKIVAKGSERIFRRATFNTHFDTMMTEVKNFINATTQQ